MTNESIVAVYLSLGSNVGAREKNLREAVIALTDFVQNVKVSSIYETAPLYVTDQPFFFNIILKGTVTIGPFELLEHIGHIETALGRDRSHTKAQGPRPIDIDILIFGRTILNHEHLVIPHPGMRTRRFVLAPLFEIDPDVVDPVSGIPFERFLADTDEQEIRLLKPWEE